MAESKKTTTVSFRIEDDLKDKLQIIAERENKTITNKAREILAESLHLSPRKTLTERLRGLKSNGTKTYASEVTV